MSRSNYADDCECWELIMWRGAVASAVRGRRGQAFLRELVGALDAMPVQRLVADSLVANGDVCAMGAVGQRRGLQLTEVDPEDAEAVAAMFGIAPALAREIAFVNDDDFCARDTPEARWTRVRQWAADQIVPEGRAG